MISRSSIVRRYVMPIVAFEVIWIAIWCATLTYLHSRSMLPIIEHEVPFLLSMLGFTIFHLVVITLISRRTPNVKAVMAQTNHKITYVLAFAGGLASANTLLTLSLSDAVICTVCLIGFALVMWSLRTTADIEEMLS